MTTACLKKTALPKSPKVHNGLSINGGMFFFGFPPTFEILGAAQTSVLPDGRPQAFSEIFALPPCTTQMCFLDPGGSGWLKTSLLKTRVPFERTPVDV